MKVQVKDKQGIDEQGNKHPAPGIADGTHECELKDKDDWGVKKGNDYYSYDTRQIWILAEQEKEGDKSLESAKEALRPHLHGFSDEQFNEEIRHFPLSEVLFAMERYADIKSTRIAELEARVAELEGVLKQMGEVDIEMITKIYDRATNALKNQQP